MEDKFKRARQYIDNQIDKDSVLRIKTSIMEKQKARTKGFDFRYSLSLLFVVCSSALIFIIFHSTTDLNIPFDSLETAQNEEAEMENGTSRPFASDEEVTKENLINRMMNPELYFDTIEGTHVFEAKEQSLRIGYNVRIDQRNNQSNAYIKSESDTANEEHYMPYESNIDIKDHLQLAGTAINPGVIAKVLSEEINHWEIIAYEELLNLQAAVIVGNISEYNDNRFKIWIHTGTGIILRLEETNKKNELVSTYRFDRISFNTEINPVSLSKIINSVNDESDFGRFSDYTLKALPPGTKRVKVNSIKNKSSSVVFIMDGQEKIHLNVFSKGVINKEEYRNGDAVSVLGVEMGFFKEERYPAIIWENSNTGKTYSIYMENGKIKPNHQQSELAELLKDIINH